MIADFEGRVLRLDPATHRVARADPGRRRRCRIAAGRVAVWVIEHGQRGGSRLHLVKLDARRADRSSACGQRLWQADASAPGGLWLVCGRHAG